MTQSPLPPPACPTLALARLEGKAPWRAPNPHGLGRCASMFSSPLPMTSSPGCHLGSVSLKSTTTKSLSIPLRMGETNPSRRCRNGEAEEFETSSLGHQSPYYSFCIHDSSNLKKTPPRQTQQHSVGETQEIWRTERNMFLKLFFKLDNQCPVSCSHNSL